MIYHAGTSKYFTSLFFLFYFLPSLAPSRFEELIFHVKGFCIFASLLCDEYTAAAVRHIPSAKRHVVDFGTKTTILTQKQSVSFFSVIPNSFGKWQTMDKWSAKGSLSVTWRTYTYSIQVTIKIIAKLVRGARGN